MLFLPESNSMISSSFSSSGLDESTTYRIRSASSAICLALPTPIFSTTSSVSRIPAVSITRSVIPFREMYSSRISLVVPSISVTIARSSPTRKLRREDLPAFGLPRITVLIPSWIILPSSAVFNRSWISLVSLSTMTLNSCG